MSLLKKHHWHKIADSIKEIDFSSTGLAEIEVSGKKICLALQDGAIRACIGKCPHAGGPLAEGYLDASGHIVCPVHHYRFSMQNGRNVSGEGYFLKTFPVEVRNGGVFIVIADSSLFD